MKTALGVSRCCCQKRLLCGPGLINNWSDDFTGYTEGQDLQFIYQTGFSTQFTASNGTGEMLRSGFPVSSPAVFRVYPGHPIEYSTWDFSLDISTASSSGYLYIFNAALGFPAPMKIYMSWFASGQLDCVTTILPGPFENTSNHILSVSDGDTLRILVEKIDYSQSTGELTSLVSFYKNGTLITSRQSQNQTDHSSWCALKHGVGDLADTTTNIDNWTFQVVK